MAYEKKGRFVLRRTTLGELEAVSDVDPDIPSLFSQGRGKIYLKELERVAKEEGADYIILKARKIVVDFYKFHGYKILEKAHTLYGCILHWKMRKDL